MTNQVEWWERGACVGTDVRTFVPGTESAVQRYCDRCPVVAACARDALQVKPYPSGVWAGVVLEHNMSMATRRALLTAAERRAS